MKRRAVARLAACSLAISICSTCSALAFPASHHGQQHQQIVFGSESDFNRAHLSSHDNPGGGISVSDDSSVPSRFHVSHSGLYVNQAHLDYVQEGISQPFTVFLDQRIYDVQKVQVRVSQVKRRSWDDVTTECYYEGDGDEGFSGLKVNGGIEACQLLDLQRARANGAKSSTASRKGADTEADRPGTLHREARMVAEDAVRDDSVCVPNAVSFDGRAFFGKSHEHKSTEHDGDTPIAAPPAGQVKTRACRLIEELLGRRRKQSGAKGATRFDDEEEEAQLFSIVISATAPLKRSSSTAADKPDQYETRHFWLAHLQQPSFSRALWPLAGNAHNETSGEVRWTGKEVNRIAGMMYDPYIHYVPSKKAASTSSTKQANLLDGVDVDNASWSLALAIRSPFNVAPTDPETEPVHAPISGQVVWKGNSSLRRKGQGKAEEEQEGEFTISIRDEWSFVWHISGLEEDTVTFKRGDEVATGEIVGEVKRQSSAPRVSAQAAAKASPYSFRSLRVAVARPDVSWTKWPSPYAKDWTYYDPLHFFVEQGSSDGQTEDTPWRSTIPPYANPVRVFYADQSPDPLGTPLEVKATSTDLFTPTLKGRVQIIVSFDAFVETPGDSGDAMDGISLYSLQWGVIRGWQDEERDWDENKCEFVGNELDGSEWHVAFERNKVGSLQQIESSCAD